MGLDISFLDKTMNTPGYVKMDAHEAFSFVGTNGDYLIQPRGSPLKSSISDSPHPAAEVQKKNEQTESSPTCLVPTIIKIQLVQSAKLLPKQTVMTLS